MPSYLRFKIEILHYVCKKKKDTSIAWNRTASAAILPTEGGMSRLVRGFRTVSASADKREAGLRHPSVFFFRSATAAPPIAPASIVSLPPSPAAVFCSSAVDAGSRAREELNSRRRRHARHFHTRATFLSSVLRSYPRARARNDFSRLLVDLLETIRRRVARLCRDRALPLSHPPFSPSDSVRECSVFGDGPRGSPRGN